MRASVVFTAVICVAALMACRTHSESGTDEPDAGGAGGATGAAVVVSSSQASTGSAPAICPGPYCSDASNCGAMDHSCLGGSCTDGACQPLLLAQHIPIPDHIALDATNVYASLIVAPNPPSDSCYGPTLIAAFSRTTGAQQTLVPCTAGSVDEVHTMVVANDTLYVALQNSSAELISVPTQGGPTFDLGDVDDADHFAVDATSIYYGRSDAGLMRMNLDGSGKTQLATDFALDIAVDDTNVSYDVAPCAESCCQALASLHTVPKSGGPSATLADLMCSNIWGIAAHDGYLYWLTGWGGEPAVRRIPTAGGPPETLYSLDDSEEIVGLAVDSSYVYWVGSGPGGSDNTFAVSRMPLSGGEPTVLAMLPDGALAIAVDDTAIAVSVIVGDEPERGQRREPLSPREVAAGFALAPAFVVHQNTPSVCPVARS